VVAPLAAGPTGAAAATARGGRAVRALLLALVLGPSFVLLAESDIHGAALAAGLAFGIVWNRQHSTKGARA
jgi:hypothetical protein